MEGIQSTHIAAKYIFRIHQSSPLLTKRGEIRLSRRTKNSTYFALWWYVQSEDLTEVGAEYTTFSSIQLLSHVQLSVTPWTVAHQASLSFTVSWLLKLMSIESVMPSNHLILCCPLFPPSIFHCIRVFSNESALRIRWPKYWSLSLSISPSSEYSGLISFRLDWLDLLAVQGTLKSLLQHHSSKTLFFSAQLSLQSNSHPYMTTGKTIALTRRTFIGKVMSLIFLI